MSLNLTTDLLNDSVDEPAISGIYIFAAIVLGLISFFGFFLNLIVILTVLNNMNILWTSINVVLINLIVSNALSSILNRALIRAKITSPPSFAAQQDLCVILYASHTMICVKLRVNRHSPLIFSFKSLSIKSRVIFL